MDKEGKRKLDTVVSAVAAELNTEYLILAEPEDAEDPHMVQIRFRNSPLVNKTGYDVLTKALKEAGLHNEREDEVAPGDASPQLMPNGAISLGGVLGFEFVDMNVRGTELYRYLGAH